MNAAVIEPTSSATAQRRAGGRADAVLAKAVDEARSAVLEVAVADAVGDHLGHHHEDERVLTHRFACLLPGYLGWEWLATLTRAPRARRATVNEVVLVPGAEAIVPPAWVPWRERIRPGDLSPGDLLPADEDDPRLTSGSFAGDVDDTSTSAREVEREIGLGRDRVLSLAGREEAAERWYTSDGGPEDPLTQSAPGLCGTCGFLVLLAGPLSGMFGVCANGQANSDGKVVSLDHGCGAHSAASLGKKHQPVPPPKPTLDESSPEDLETF